MIASNFRAAESGALRGFFDLELPSGMIIRGVMVFEKDGRRWLGMPSKQIAAKDGGKPTYKPHIEFVDRATAERFKDGALAALDVWVAV